MSSSISSPRSNSQANPQPTTPTALGAGRSQGRTTEQSSDSRARRFEPDLIRVVALVLVVVIHASPWPRQSDGAASFYSLLALLARPSVPLLVILSGLLLAPGESRPPADASFWRRRLGRTLLPWLPWALVYFLVDVVFTNMAPGLGSSWGWWVGGAGHLYFLLLIPQLYLLLAIWPNSRRGQKWALLAAVLIQVGVQLVRVVATLPAPGNSLTLSFGYELAPFWVGYFAIGLWLGPRLGGLRTGWLTLPVCLIAVAASALLVLRDPLSQVATHWGPWVEGTGAFLRPSLLLLTLAAFVFLWRLAKWVALGFQAIQRAIGGLSRHALGIYIVHPVLLLGIGTALQGSPGPLSLEQPLPGSLLPFALLIGLAVLGAWVVTRALAAIPALAWTVGESVQPLRGR